MYWTKITAWTIFVNFVLHTAGGEIVLYNEDNINEDDMDYIYQSEQFLDIKPKYPVSRPKPLPNVKAPASQQFTPISGNSHADFSPKTGSVVYHNESLQFRPEQSGIQKPKSVLKKSESSLTIGNYRDWSEREEEQEWYLFSDLDGGEQGDDYSILSRHRRAVTSGDVLINWSMTILDWTLPSARRRRKRAIPTADGINSLAEARTAIASSLKTQLESNINGATFSVDDATMTLAQNGVNVDVSGELTYQAEETSRTEIGQAFYYSVEDIGSTFTIGSTSMFDVGQTSVEPEDGSTSESGHITRPSICFICSNGYICTNASSTDGNWYCSLGDARFYPFGTSIGDQTVARGSELASGEISLNPSMTFNQDIIDKIWVSVNGFVSFGEDYGAYVPVALPDGNHKLVCPYWCDLDLSASNTNGNVYYNWYSGTDVDDTGLIMRATADVKKYNTDELTDFSATKVVVATWEQMPPYWAVGNETVTFQLVLISDGEYTFAMFIYLQAGMKLDATLNRDVEIGWGSLNLDTRNNYYVFDEISGNTNPSEPGLWFFKIGHKANSRAECATWLIAQQSLLRTILFFNNFVPACPCNQFVAIVSALWVNNYEDNYVTCYDSLPLFGLYGRRCCFRNDFSLSFENRIPYAGNFQYISPLAGLPDEFHELTDARPKRWCCTESDLASQCQSFYVYRPVRTCVDRTEMRANMFGDPHVTTMDNRNFIFNGLGEYRLLEVDATITTDAQSKNISFKMQARTCIAKNKNGENTDATVWCALALKVSNGAEISVEISSAADSVDPYLVIYFNGVDYSARFRDQDIFETYAKNMFIKKMNKTNILSISSSDQVGAEVTLTNGILNIVPTVGSDYIDKTSGLLGNYNGDQTDDFRSPDGTVLNDNITEREIFDYAQLWAVTDEISVFRRENGDTTATFTNTTFTPIYYDEQTTEVKNAAANICGGIENIACVFDYIATQNEQFAKETKQTVTNYIIQESKLENSAPIVNGSDKINVAVGEEASFELIASDKENGELRFKILNQPSASEFKYTVPNNSFVGTFTPINTNPTKIEIVVIDDKDLESEVKAMEVVVCTNCNGQGTCDYNNTVETSESNYKVASCICNTGYSGIDCNEDKDGCAPRPCPEGTTCTDLSVAHEISAGKAYLCSACPYGTKLNSDGSKCEDVDECLIDGSCPTNSTCTNSVGSYVCTCISGYRMGQLNGRAICNDINECQENSYSCEQICVNEIGSYTCECNTGFASSGALGFNCTKIEALDPCKDLQATCEYGCLNTTGVAECYCSTGYSLDTTDNSSCQDDDECSFDSLCAQKCQNSPGSFACSCFPGYKLAADLLDCTVCDSNMYGEGCGKRCDCRGRADRCDNVKGCICNKFWSGESCEIDVNECEQEDSPCPGTQICRNLNGSFACDCPAGYEKNPNDTNACIDANECSSAVIHKCPLQSTCKNNPGSFTCLCIDGYVYNTATNNCDDINECTTGISGCEQICSNNNGSYNCECNQGYLLKSDRLTCMKVEEICSTYDVNCTYACRVEGTTPECYCGVGYELSTDARTCLDINECENSTLNQCADPNTCKNTQGSYECSCPTGEKLQNDARTCQACDSYHWGDNCINQCDCNPVGKDTCDPVTGCKCLAGWTGNKCEDDINECSTSAQLCPSGADCINSLGSYLCQCRSGFEKSGSDNCTDIDECLQNPCDHNCENTIGGYICTCYAGFVNNAMDNDQCDDIDECILQTVHTCQQECRNTQGSYVCECYDGFTLDLTDRRKCEEIQKTTCTDKNCSYVCSIVDNKEQCLCDSGNTLDTDNQTCIDINECQTQNPCNNATCNNLEPGFECTCENGFKLADDQVSCKVCNDGYFGTDCAQACTCSTPNTLSCSTVDGSCDCVNGWEGTNCDTDTDECKNVSPPCDGIGNSQCVNTDGSFKCVCDTGFVNSDGKCIACDSTSYGQDCGQTCACVQVNTQDCNDVDGTCTCKTGWEGDTCADDINECSDPNHCPGIFQTCNNLNGAAECICETGYSRLNVNETCAECGPTRYGTQCAQSCSCVYANTKECNHVTGDCTCIQGYKGTNCETDINECTEDNHVCSTNEYCFNTPGSVQCNCNVGFYRPPTTSVCTACTSTTYGQDCENTCSCEEANTADCNDVDGTCTCNPGYEGTNCSAECSDTTYGQDCSSQCTCVPSNTADCNNVDGSCTCNPGYEGTDCGAECSATTFGQDCGSQCTCVQPNTADCNNVDGTCACNPGYEGTDCGAECSATTFGQDCGSQCTCVQLNTADCNNVDGSCTCVTGWEGPDCQTDIDECSQSQTNCTNNQKCENNDGSYRCVDVTEYSLTTQFDLTITNPEILDNTTTAFTDFANTVREALLEMYKKINPAIIDVTVTGFRNATDENGSLIADHVVSVDSTTGTSTDAIITDVAIASSDDSIAINGTQYPSEKVTYKNVPVTNNTNPCELLNCTPDQICETPVGSTVTQCVEGLEDYTMTTWINYTLPATNNAYDNSTQDFQDLAKEIAPQLLTIFHEISTAVSNVTITNFRDGSLIIDSIITIDRTATNDPLGVVRNVSIHSAHQKSFTIDGTTVVINGVKYGQVNVTCVNMTCPEDCNDIEGLGQCIDFTTTVTEPTTTDATTSAPSSDENRDLIIGLSVGIPLFCLFTLLIAIIVYMYVRGKRRSQQQSSQRSVGDRGAPFQSVFATGMATKGSWGAQGSRLYRPDAYSDAASSVSSGDGHLIKTRHKGRSDFQDSPWYDNRGATPRGDESRGAPTEAAGPTSNFSWEYMFQLLEPHRELQIERPQVSPRPNPMHTPRGSHHQQRRPDSMA